MPVPATRNPTDKPIMKTRVSLYSTFIINVVGFKVSGTIIKNVNGLNAPTKRHRLAKWIQKQDLYICCLQETHFRHKDTYRLKVRGWKNVIHANGKQKKAGVAILISDKIDLKIKITRDKEGH